MNALDVNALTKIYPAFRLDGVSFCVREGHIAGLIGRNGAGKSTTINGIMRFIDTSGDVNVFGMNTKTDELGVKRIIGYVGGGFGFYPQKTLEAIANIVSAFYPNWDNNKYSDYIDKFGLNVKKKIRELSDGMRVKFALALAMSHGARLLIMDEPTSGLDPLSREEFCDIVLSLAKDEGVSVLFSTHITSDLMRIADDIVYISGGKVLIDEPLSELLVKYKLVRFDNEKDAQTSNVIGLKRVRDGFEGIVPSGQAVARKVCDATLDHIMIHLDAEKEGVK